MEAVYIPHKRIARSKCKKISLTPDFSPDFSESRPGWNQHGGPELFTTGNHKPGGGLVLFMKGEDELTVRFIRRQEDVRKLRWK